MVGKASATLIHSLFRRTKPPQLEMPHEKQLPGVTKGWCLVPSESFGTVAVYIYIYKFESLGTLILIPGPTNVSLLFGPPRHGRPVRTHVLSPPHPHTEPTPSRLPPPCRCHARLPNVGCAFPIEPPPRRCPGSTVTRQARAGSTPSEPSGRWSGSQQQERPLEAAVLSVAW